MNIKSFFINERILQKDNPFDSVKVNVLLGFSIFMLLNNIPYTVVAYSSHISHFISALIQNAVLIFIFYFLKKSDNIKIAVYLYLSNGLLQNIFHLYINNFEISNQAVLFLLLLVLQTYILLNKRIGLLVLILAVTFILVGTFNQLSNYSLVKVPTILNDPTMEGPLQYMIVFPFLLNAYMVGAFVNAQTKAKELLNSQKNTLSLKNREINESLNYAKRIQQAIMPSEYKMNFVLKDSFVLYLPKDVVAGDFFWLEKKDNRIYFAAADCTGHGVPGALVSVVCSNALTKSLIEEGNTETDKLLARTREIVIENFSKNDEEKKLVGASIKDGMDITLCSLDFNTLNLQWSGANNPLWFIRNNELQEIKADKQPIGFTHSSKPFTSHSINLELGDLLYLSTDGFQDQFGGPKGKKFKPSQLKEILLKNHHLSMIEQQECLLNSFNHWKRDLEQVDDICIIGVKI